MATTEKIYRCKKCGEQFVNKKDTEKHIKECETTLGERLDKLQSDVKNMFLTQVEFAKQISKMTGLSTVDMVEAPLPDGAKCITLIIKDGKIYRKHPEKDLCFALDIHQFMAALVRGDFEKL